MFQLKYTYNQLHTIKQFKFSSKTSIPVLISVLLIIKALRAPAVEQAKKLLIEFTKKSLGPRMFLVISENRCLIPKATLIDEDTAIKAKMKLDKQKIG